MDYMINHYTLEIPKTEASGLSSTSLVLRATSGNGVPVEIYETLEGAEEAFEDYDGRIYNEGNTTIVDIYALEEDGGDIWDISVRDERSKEDN